MGRARRVVTTLGVTLLVLLGLATTSATARADTVEAGPAVTAEAAAGPTAGSEPAAAPEPEPTEPEPTVPAPSGPEPTVPEPAVPEPTEAEPIQAQPTEPEPAAPDAQQPGASTGSEPASQPAGEPAVQPATLSLTTTATATAAASPGWAVDGSTGTLQLADVDSLVQLGDTHVTWTAGADSFTESIAGLVTLLLIGGSGGPGGDTLSVPDAAGLWVLTGLGSGRWTSGTRPRVEFSGFEHLVGAPTAGDTFDIQDGGGVSGSIDDGAGALTVVVGGFASVTGDFAFAPAQTRAVTVRTPAGDGNPAGSTSTSATVIRLGGAGGTGFAGIDPLGVRVGLAGDLTRFGLALVSDGQRAWLSFAGAVADPELTGIGSGLGLGGAQLALGVHRAAADGSWIDLSGAPITVATSAGDVVLAEDGPGTAAEMRAVLRLADALLLGGTLTVRLGEGTTVDVATGLSPDVSGPLKAALDLLDVAAGDPADGVSLRRASDYSRLWNLPVSVLEIALSDVGVFAGSQAGWVDADGDGVMQLGELGADAAGFFAGPLDVGLVMMAASGLADGLEALAAVLPRFTALQADGDAVTLLGLPFLTLAAFGVGFQVNTGTRFLGDTGTGPAPVVDWRSSFPGSPGGDEDAGYAVRTATGDLVVRVDADPRPLAGVSVETGLLQIGTDDTKVVHLSGGLAFRFVQGQTVDVVTGLLCTGTVTAECARLTAIPVGDGASGALQREADYSRIHNVPVTAIEVGVGDVSVFVGYGLQAWTPFGAGDAAEPDGAPNGILDPDELGQDAVGLYAGDVDLGLVLLTAVPVVGSGLDPLLARALRFTALSATAARLALVGVPYLVVEARRVSFEVNTGQAWTPGAVAGAVPVVDFTTLDGGAYQVQTGRDEPIEIDANEAVIAVEAGLVLLQVADAVHVSGSFAFRLGAERVVDVATGLVNAADALAAGAKCAIDAFRGNSTCTGTGGYDVVEDLRVRSIDIGVGNASIFIGANFGSWVPVEGGDETLHRDDLHPDAVGFFAGPVDMGMVLMAPVATGDQLALSRLMRFLAFELDLAELALLGIPFVTFGASGVHVEVNAGQAWAGAVQLPAAVVDWKASFPEGQDGREQDGYAIHTGRGPPVVVDLDGTPVVGASANQVRLQVGDWVHLSGGFSFRVGSITHVDVATGLLDLTQAGAAAAALATITTEEQLAPGLSAEARATTLYRDGIETIHNVRVRTIEIGIDSASLFVGAGLGDYDPEADTDLTLDRSDICTTSPGQPEDCGDAVGLFVADVDLGLLMMAPVLGGGLPPALSNLLRFMALRAAAENIDLLGIPYVTLAAAGVTVEVNAGSRWTTAPRSPEAVIDWQSSYPGADGQAGTADDGYPVRTSTENDQPVRIAFEGDPLVGAAAEYVVLKISEYVHVTGGFSFRMGEEEVVDVVTGLVGTRAPGTDTWTPPLSLGGLAGLPTECPDDEPACLHRSADYSTIHNVPVATMTVGVSDASVFLGAGLAAWERGGVGDDAEGAAGYGILDRDELGPDAVGFWAGDVDLGLAMLTPLTGTGLSAGVLQKMRFTGMKATVAGLEVVGLDFLTLSLSGVTVEVNSGVPWTGTDVGQPAPTVDWAASFPDTGGFRVATGNAPVLIDLDGDPLIAVSVQRALLQIADNVHLSGAFSFRVGPVETVDVVTGLRSAVGIGGVSTPPAEAPALGLITQVSETDPGDGSLARTADYSRIWNLRVSTFQVGVQGASLFVGDGMAAWAPTEAAPVLTEADLGENAVGFFVGGITLGFALMSPLTISPQLRSLTEALRFFALVGTADELALKGIPEVVVSASGIGVAINHGRPWVGARPGAPAAVIDWQSSFPAEDEESEEGDGEPSPAGYHVQTGLEDVVIDLRGTPLVSASAEFVLLRISEFVHVSGAFSFALGAVEYVDVATGLNPVTVGGSAPGLITNITDTAPEDDEELGRTADFGTIWNLPVSTLQVGAHNANVFVGFGLDPAWVPEGPDDVLDADAVGPSAVGFLVTGLDFGLVAMTPLPGAIPAYLGVLPRFVALRGNSDFLGFVGIDGFQLHGSGLRVEVNNGSPWTGAVTGTGVLPPPVVDFTKSFGDQGYAVTTGQVDENGDPVPVRLAYEGPILGGGADNVTIQIAGFVHLTGSIYFEIGAVHDVRLVPALIDDEVLDAVLEPLGLSEDEVAAVIGLEKEVRFLTIGGKDLHAFVGVNGPYWVDADGDGEIDRDALDQIVPAEVNAEAIGLVLDQLTFGLAIMTPVNTFDPSRYLALSASAAKVALVGIPGVTVNAENIDIELNIATPLVGGFPLLPVVDFVESFGETGYGVKTGALDDDGADVVVPLTFENLWIRASARLIELDILGLVTLTGSLAFNLGPTTCVYPVGAGPDAGCVEVTTMTIGGSDIYGFIGLDGPYAVDGNGNGVIDLDLDGRVAAADRNADAIGLALNDLDVGLFVGAAAGLTGLGGFIAGKLDIGSIEVVGITGFTLVGLLSIALNFGFGTFGVAGIDFRRSFPEGNPRPGGAAAGVGGDGSGGGDPGDGGTPPPPGYSVDTGDPTSPVLLDFDRTFVEIQLAGVITVGGYAHLEGVFYLDVDDEGLKLFADADLTIGPDIGSGSTFLDLHALGVLIVNADGVAADLQVSLAFGDGTPDASIGTITARLLLNTTGRDQELLLPDRLLHFVQANAPNTLDRLTDCSTDPASSDDPPCWKYVVSGAAPTLDGSPSTPGAYVAVFFSADLAIAADWVLSGDFRLIAGAGDFVLSIDAELRLGPLGSVDASGELQITSAGLYASLDVSRVLGSEAVGFRWATSGTFRVDTRADTFEIYVSLSGELEVLGFASAQASGTVRVTGGSFELEATLDFTVGPLSFTAHGEIGVFANGLYVKLHVGLDVHLLSLFHVQASGDVEFDTRPGQRFFRLDLHGDLDVLGIITMNGDFSVVVAEEAWRIDLALDASLASVVNLSASGWITSNGHFDLTLTGGVTLGTSSTGISGQMRLTASFDGTTFSFGVGGSFSARLGGVELFGVSAGGSVSGTLGGTVTLRVTVSGTGLFFDVINEIVRMTAEAAADAGYAVLNFLGDLGCEIASWFGACDEWVEVERPREVWQWRIGSFTLDVATFTLPGSLTNAPPPPPNLATLDPDGTLRLNVGDRANLRTVGVGAHDEAYEITRVSGADGTETLRVTAFGRTETFVGVARIDARFGDGADSLRVDAGVLADVLAYGGADHDVLTHLGSGSALLYGEGGDDRLSIGGAATGDRDSLLLDGGEGNDTLSADTGHDVTLRGGGGNDVLLGGGGDDLLDGGAGNDTLSGRGGADALDGGAGDDQLGDLLADLTSGETWTGGDGVDRVRVTGTDGADDVRVDVVGGALRTAAYSGGTRLASVTVTGVEALLLDVLGGADTVLLDGDLSAGGLRELTVDLRGRTGVGTAGPDASADTVHVRPGATADQVKLSTVPDGTRLSVRPGTGGWVAGVVGASAGTAGDVLRIDTGDGADRIDASLLLPGQWGRVQLVAGAGDDLVIGSQGADEIDSGTGDDTVSGLGGQDVFTDADGTDVLREITAEDVGLHGTTLVVATATVTGSGETLAVSFTGGTAEDVAVFEELRISGSVAGEDNVVAIGYLTGTAWTTPVALDGVGGDDLYLLYLAGVGPGFTLVLRESVALTVPGGAVGGSDTLVVLGSPGADTVTVSAAPADGETLVEGATAGGRGAAVTIGSQLEALQVWTLGDADTVVVRATRLATTVGAGTGSDTLLVGSTSSAAAGTASGLLDGVDAPLVVHGGEGSDVLRVSDDAESADGSGTLGATTLHGFGLHVGGVTFTGWETVEVVLGSGADALLVTGSAAGTGTTVRTGAGSDTVSVSSTAGSLDAVAGPVTLDLGAGSDALHLLDVADATGDTGTLTATSLTGLSPGAITYLAVEDLVVRLGTGHDVLTVLSTHGGTTTVAAGPGDDRVDVEAVTGPTTVLGDAGADTLRVNPAGDPLVETDVLDAVVTLDGGQGDDTYSVDAFGDGDSTVVVADSGTTGVDTLTVGGTETADTVLLRAALVAVLTGVPGAGGAAAHAELVRYSGLESLILLLRGGDDRLVADDTTAPLQAFGGDGDDEFQVGQAYGAGRSLLEEPVLVETTRGWLTNGVSRTATLFGEAGDDRFTVLRNVAQLRLEGGAGNDEFVVRTFVSTDAGTSVAGGGEADTVRYVANAPLDVDGGEGHDRLVLIGTEAGDVLLVTSDAVHGLGRVVGYTGVEELVVDMLEGDDLVVVASTLPGVTVRVVGGLGSDTVVVGGGVPAGLDTGSAGPPAGYPAHRLDGVRGPVHVLGGLDHDDNGAVDRSGLPPLLLLPGESADPGPAAQSPTADVVEERQVDVLVLDDTQAPTGRAGELTAGGVTGLGLGAPLAYTGLEVVRLLLGPGSDALTVVTTHAGTTEVEGGEGADTVTVRSVSGPTRVATGGGEDLVTVTDAGDVAGLSALLVVDTGAGQDRLVVDDSADSLDRLATLTGTSLVGLGMGSGAVLHRISGAGGPLAVTVTVDGVAVSGVVDLADLAAGLQALLFPDATSCGRGGESLCARSVLGWQVGGAWLVHFLGELAGTDVTLGSGGTDVRRDTGVEYAAVELLDLLLGAGHDRLDVRGTTATTAVHTGGGDDVVAVSGAADLARLGQVPPGGDLEATADAVLHTPVRWDEQGFTATLDDLLGDLALELGGGSNSLLVSDRASTAGDADVRVTATSVTGLAPGAISFVAGGGDLAGQGHWTLALGDLGLFARGLTVVGGAGGNAYTVTGVVSAPPGGAFAAVTTLFAGAGDDRVTVGVPATARALLAVHGEAGNDVVDSSAGGHPLVALGGDGDDTLTGGSGHDVLFGDGGRVHHVLGGGLPDVVLGGAATEAAAGTGQPQLPSLVVSAGGETGSDVLLGGDGNDVLVGGWGGDHLDGGAGADLLLGDAARLLGAVDLATLPWAPHFTFGSAFADDPRGGDDTLTGEAGSDVLLGQQGSDLLRGGGDDDVLVGDQAWFGAAGRPGSCLTGALRGSTLWDGIDTPCTAPQTAGWRVELLDGGLPGGDTLLGDAGRDLLLGQRGDDTLRGGDGDDYAEGGPGSDVLWGDGGADDLVGGGSGIFWAVLDDAGDTLHGGSAPADRNDLGSGSAGADADVLLGDNGRVLRPSGVSFVHAPDVAPRVVELLGGGSGDDVLRGGDGNDVLHGQAGDDVLYGDAGDDDLVGGDGSDWLSGGTGTDGLLGDSGRIVTSVNGSTEPLLGVTSPTTQGSVSVTSLDLTVVLHETGRLVKAAVLAPRAGDGDDVLFGGLGDDFLHGGAGDDALSGAEALPAVYASPVAGPGQLGYDPTRREFAAYDEKAPLRRIAGFFLDFAEAEADGGDVLFGDEGNDWLVGGRGADHLYGGLGDDLLDADDDHSTAGGQNTAADAAPTDGSSIADIAFGGGGRDVLLAGSHDDRLVDWAGEFNSYVVPVNRFGKATITRGPEPAAIELLLALAGSDGADPDALGDPEGELGLVTQDDPQWGDQHGAPADPQPGNNGGVSDGGTATESSTGLGAGDGADTAEVQAGTTSQSGTDRHDPPACGRRAA